MPNTLRIKRRGSGSAGAPSSLENAELTMLGTAETVAIDKDNTTIVNGSGKSNVVEAIKWVMGENSSKSLRGSGMNDLIFSGSASKASKNIALVSLTLKTQHSQAPLLQK